MSRPTSFTTASIRFALLAAVVLGAPMIPAEAAVQAPFQLAARTASQATAFVGKHRLDVVRTFGTPEQATAFQTIYNLPGQRPLQWLFYQRESLLIGVNKADVVEAVLFLPSYPDSLAGGLRMEMKRAQVTQLIGAPDYTIPEQGGTERYIYAARTLDLTFDVKSDTLVQVLFYPSLKSLTGLAPAPSTKPTRHPVAVATVRPLPRPTPTPMARPRPTARPTPVALPTLKPTPKPTARPTPTPRPTATPTPHPTATPTPRPTATPTPRPTAKPTLKPTPRPTAKPTPRPTPRPTPMATPRPRPTPKVIERPLAPLTAPVSKTGSASIVGLVSYFLSETGEIQYLHGVQFYVSAEPLDTALLSGSQALNKVQSTAAQARHRARIWNLIKAGRIISGIESDKFGRFKFNALPAGDFYLFGIHEETGRYMVWQRKITLTNNRQFRLYLNRNNLALSGQ